jgi:hypothetical protein
MNQFQFLPAVAYSLITDLLFTDLRASPAIRPVPATKGERANQAPHPAGGYSFVPHRFINALLTPQRTIGCRAAIRK